MLDSERRKADAVDHLSPKVRRALLAAIMAPPPERAEWQCSCGRHWLALVMAFQGRGAGRAPKPIRVMIDLEDRLVGLAMVDALKQVPSDPSRE